MKDKLSIERVQELHPKFRQIASDFITECENTFDITLRIAMGYRTIEQQNALYAKGRTEPGEIITNAPGGKSFHNFGLAIDLCHISDDLKSIDWHFDMSKLKPIADKYGLEWGGSWTTIKDYPHFELRLGLHENCSDALAMVNEGKVDADGYILV